MAAAAAAAASAAKFEVTTLAGGCFWCIEATFSRIRGVRSAISGYTHGHTKDPKYKDICEGDTGHAEAVQVTFDSAEVPFEKLLKIFFTVHDPTQLNRQGNDVGTQYRSGIYYHSEEQKAAAEAFIKELQAKYAKPIVTEVKAATTFYPAEDYHQGYFDKNPGQGYCRAVVAPKVHKAETTFPEQLK